MRWDLMWKKQKFTWTCCPNTVWKLEAAACSMSITSHCGE